MLRESFWRRAIQGTTLIALTVTPGCTTQGREDLATSTTTPTQTQHLCGLGPLALMTPGSRWGRGADFEGRPINCSLLNGAYRLIVEWDGQQGTVVHSSGGCVFRVGEVKLRNLATAGSSCTITSLAGNASGARQLIPSPLYIHPSLPDIQIGGPGDFQFEHEFYSKCGSPNRFPCP